MLARALTIGTIAIALPALSWAAPMSDAWVARAPTVDQIFHDIQGSDLLDTRARQAAAFEILRHSVQVWAGTVDLYQMPPLGAQRFREYHAAMNKQPYDVQFDDGTCRGSACLRAQFINKQSYYKADPAFIRELLGRYVAPEYVQASVDRMAKLYGTRPPRVAVVPKSAPAKVQSHSPQRQPKSGISTLQLSALVGGGILLLVFVIWLLGRKKAPDPRPPLTDIHGKARWAAVQQGPITNQDILRGVTFGKSSGPRLPADAPGAPITSLPETHTLIVARTRAGKGTRVIVPTLLRYGGSMLVIDPKGENAAITARTRRDQLGQDVHIVNPWGEMQGLYESLGFKPASFNPLDAIDRNDPNAVAVAQTLAATICPVSNEKDKFWQGSAANVLAGVFLWIADHPGEQKTLARAREIVTQSRADFLKTLAQMVTSTAYHGAVKEMVSQYIDLAPETYSGIMSNLAENTKFLSDPRIKTSTGVSSFSLRKLRDVFTTVYLVIPHDRIQTHATWLRLVIASAMQALKGRNALTDPPHHRCMFLIDEFGSIGHIPDIPRDIALMSGYGLDFTLIVQGLDQLKHHYKDAQATILSNCAYKWFCFVNELDTAKYLSESLGKATVRTVGKSLSSGVAGGGGATSAESINYGETGRSLLNPDEILNLGRDAAILLNPSGSPHYLRPVDYWNLAETFAHIREDVPHFYWDPPLAYDENPYFTGGPPSQEGATGTMSWEEARSCLGVGKGADKSEIIERWQLMMKHLGPHEHDIARKISEARAVLLGE